MKSVINILKMQKNTAKANVEKGSKRLDHLRQIETNLQKEWKEKKLFEATHEKGWEEKYSFEEKNKQKYLVTFPYPYMNGRLHLGHAFSMSKCEFQSRYQRLLGKNVLFPFAFHCTGMPIAAAAKRVQKEMKEGFVAEKGAKTQGEILKQVGVSEEDIPKFADPYYWLEYFPPIGQQDLEAFGVNCDFTRSFITTDRQKFYDKFIQWQFKKLKEAGKIKFGKRYTIFSRSDNQPCADHDRSEGEGLGPMEYTLVKLKVVDNIPEKLKKYTDNKNVYLVPATLRPETMYGQTNCYLLPTGEYGLYEMKNGDLFICSEQSAINMSYQELTAKPFEAPALEKFFGKELIGVCVEAPLSVYKRIYAIPMETISMTKGTGVVTSVPSDAPDDWVTLREFKNDEKLRQKWGITPEMVNVEPVHIIKTPGYSDLPAVEVCDKYEIKNPKEKEKLAKAKDEVYSKGFYSGVMSVGQYKDIKVADAKPKIKTDLMSDGLAVPYYEPEGVVKNRTGELCIVALVDQWLINYGEDSWKQFIMDHVNSPNFNAYNSHTHKNFTEVINWLKEWGCSRTFGLGSLIPWDSQYLIESLSDSTIYMAYYTIANYLHEDMYGDKPKNGLTSDMFTYEVFDYIFLGKELKETTINTDLLKEMRESFNYWYPMDLRCSGKDLIGNHLTMSLYNHAAIWNDEKYMTRAYFCNGYILVNGEKMSKNKGNFFTVEEIIQKYGCDASRLAIANCGDGLDDANFETEIADSAINRLYSFENFVKILINETWEKNKVTFTDPDSTPLYNNDFDKIFDNNINFLLEKTKIAYEHMRYKDVLKYGFYEMINNSHEYILYNEDDYNKLNPTLMLKFLKTFFVVINPIAPHWSEYMFRTYLNPIFKANGFNDKTVDNLAFSRFPLVNSQIDSRLFHYNKYIKKVIENIREVVNTKTAVKGGKKNEKKEDKKEEKSEEKVDNTYNGIIRIFYAPHFTNEQKRVYEILKSAEYNEWKITTDYKKIIMTEMEKHELRTLTLQFASFIVKEIETYGFDVLNAELPFDELNALNENLGMIKKLSKANNIVIEVYDEKKKPKAVKSIAIPGKPIIHGE